MEGRRRRSHVIPFDFEYYRPDSVAEAVCAFQELSAQGREPMYYGGGTEILSFARCNALHTGAVIDLKAVPECGILEFVGDRLVIGSAVTLTRIHESKLFPLLGDTAARIAEHTIQDKITLGGNLCAQIIYRECALPLLLSDDAEAVVAGPEGTRQVPFRQVFGARLELGQGEFLAQVSILERDTRLPHFHRKQTKLDKIDYPLVTVAAVKRDGRIQAAFSGLCAYPFRSVAVENALNAPGVPPDQRISSALGQLPAPVMADIHGSMQYRRHIAGIVLDDAMELLEGVG